LQDVSLSKFCGSGLVFVVFPFVSFVVVVPTPAWLFPGPTKVVQVTVPRSLVQLSGNGPADAVAAPTVDTPATNAESTMTLRIRFMVFSDVCERPRQHGWFERNKAAGAARSPHSAFDHYAPFADKVKT
jgi:hypothetical protein